MLSPRRSSDRSIFGPANGSDAATRFCLSRHAGLGHHGGSHPAVAVKRTSSARRFRSRWRSSSPNVNGRRVPHPAPSTGRVRRLVLSTSPRRRRPAACRQVLWRRLTRIGKCLDQQCQSDVPIELGEDRFERLQSDWQHGRLIGGEPNLAASKRAGRNGQAAPPFQLDSVRMNSDQSQAVVEMTAVPHSTVQGRRRPRSTVPRDSRKPISDTSSCPSQVPRTGAALPGAHSPSRAATAGVTAPMSRTDTDVRLPGKPRIEQMNETVGKHDPPADVCAADEHQRPSPMLPDPILDRPREERVTPIVHVFVRGAGDGGPVDWRVAEPHPDLPSGARDPD